MIRRRKRYAERLGRVVESLPFETQSAMLEGLRRYDRVITGAYTDREGGVCPMLAAHRCGGRTDYRSFARAWDRFTGATRRPRAVSERELRTLTAQLEASVWREEKRRELARLARESVEHGARRHAAECQRRSGKTRVAQQRLRQWLGPFRRWDRYRDTVARVSRDLERSGLVELRAEIDRARSGERDLERV
ncbi:MAG: hypothetical protein WDZ37_00230 [Solirubrobacterales bacterium]